MRRSLGLKFLVIAGLTSVILIALYMVGDTISSREGYRDAAVTSISESYAGPQSMVGPILVQPYSQITETVGATTDGKTKITTDQHEGSEVTFPTTLTIKGKMIPSERRHGLYRAAVYVLDAQMTGVIDAPDPVLEGKVTFGEPYLAFSLSDVRGIIGKPSVQVNGATAVMTQGGVIKGSVDELTAEPRARDARSFLTAKYSVRESSDHWEPNLRVRLPDAPRGKKGRYEFNLGMQVAGTQRLSLAPVGDLNEFQLNSTWPSPLFGGRFLPQAPTVSAAGFHAAWSLSSLATQSQQQVITREGTVDMLNVSLLTTVDPYKLSDRAVKYGILFILLTFGGFFIFEIMKHLPIHPVQYLLVGLGLTIFFLLLISLSEHVSFGLAYLLASLGCIGLLTFYLSFVLRSLGYGLGFGALLTSLYGCIYGLLMSEDNALLLGSLMLFGLLAAVMFVTRKVDWYRDSAELSRVREVESNG